MAPIVVIGLALAIRRGALPRRAWWVAVALQVVVVAGGAAAFKAGEREEKRVEGYVSEALVGEHEERAEMFLWSAGVTLAVAAAALVVPASAVPAAGVIAACATIATASLGLYAGKAGGELVYRHGAAQAYSTAEGARPSAVARQDPRGHSDRDDLGRD